MREFLTVNEKENSVLVSVDSKIYSLDVIYTAAYVFLEKAYLVLDGDPKKEVKVKLTAKIKYNRKELDTLGKEFLNELINYGFHKKQSEQTKQIKQIILQRALLTNLGGGSIFEEDLEEFEDLKCLEEDSEEIEDPEGIAIPWEEKYGNKRKKDSKQ